ASWEGHDFTGPTARADWYYEVGQDGHSLHSLANPNGADPKFVNPTGPDGILGFSTNADTSSPAQIIDNDSASGFATTGTWTKVTGSGFNNDYLQSTTSADVATYTFGVTPGWYQVAATWPATGNEIGRAHV